MHTAISSLPSELRQFIRFDGVAEPLRSIDAANSQMVFIAAAALKASNDAADAVDFADTCARGEFYEECWRVLHGDEVMTQRATFKGTAMGSWLYVRRGIQANSKLGEALAARWPSVHGYMLEQKTRGTRDLPCLMQRLEAGVWHLLLEGQLDDFGGVDHGPEPALDR